MRNVTLMAVVVCLLLNSCSEDSLSVRRQMLERTNVTAQFDSWVRAISNLERDSVAGMYDQVAELRTVYPNGQISRGWEEERSFQSEFFERAELVNFVTRGLEVEIIGPTMANTTFRFSIDLVMNGEQLAAPVEGFATILWLKDIASDRWKIHTQHASIALPFNN